MFDDKIREDRKINLNRLLEIIKKEENAIINIDNLYMFIIKQGIYTQKYQIKNALIYLENMGCIKVEFPMIIYVKDL